MDYHKDQLRFTRAQTYLRAPLTTQAAHAWLIRYCAIHETGGVIATASRWTPRDWQTATHAQITLRHVRAVIAAGLASWDGVDLIVHGYDRKGETWCQRERERLQAHRDRTASRTGTAPRSEPGPDQSSPDQSSPGSPPSPSSTGANAKKHDGDDDGVGPSVSLDQARKRIDGINLHALRRAMRDGDLLGLILACGGTTGTRTDDEWRLAADGLNLGTLGTILLWRRGQGDPVRLPSGLRQARELWRNHTPEERAAIATHHRDALGIAEVQA